MNQIAKIKSSEVCSLVPKPRYVLATTYTLSLAFFESVVFQYIGRSNLRSCLILCDAIGYDRALSEGAALQSAAQDYMVVPAPGSGCFHPKVWIIIGDGEAVVLVGSGNLTQAGFMTNTEFFDALHFTDESPATPRLIENIRSFVRGLARMWSPADARHLLCVDTLTKIDEALQEAIPVASDAEEKVHFLHSFNGKLIEQMPEVTDAQELYIASPFFGNSLGGVDLFAHRYPSGRLNIFPGVHDGKATDIPREQLSATHKKAKVSRLSIPGKRNDSFAHLKLYGITGRNGPAWLCCTSANCTAAAWTGSNVEAGLLRSIPKSLLPDYFISSDLSLPQETITYNKTEASDGILHIWALDTGMHLEIVVADGCSSCLPLRDVKITVRSGSNLAITEKPHLFQSDHVDHIVWGAFPDWNRRKKMAVCLEIEGTTSRSNIVRGRCFVENRLLLTADPIHRSAWRGALTLLDDEGSPELADIAALFSLARDLFDGTLVRLPNTSPSSNGASIQTDEEKPRPLAVWPPQADTTDLQKRIGSTAVGQLQWFQRILQTLLQNDKCDEKGVDSASGGDALDKSAEVETPQTPDDDAIESVARRVWKKAVQDYTSLYSRLLEMVPTMENAQNIWPAAVFAFLSTMAVLRKVKRIAPGIELHIETETLCDDFLRVMLSERKQHDDFCCPIGFRYRSEKFPAIADDLRITFKISLHHELSIVMLALIVDHKLRAHANVAAFYGNKQVAQVCGDDFTASNDTGDTCQKIWERYLLDPDAKTPSEKFIAAFQTLTLPGSANVPQ